MPYGVSILFSPKNESAVLSKTIDGKWEGSEIVSINGYPVRDLDSDTVDALFDFMNEMQGRVSIILINGKKLEYPYIAELDTSWGRKGVTFAPNNNMRLGFDGEKFVGVPKHISRDQLANAFFGEL